MQFTADNRTIEAYGTSMPSDDETRHISSTRQALARELAAQVYGGRGRRRPSAGEVLLALAEMELAA